MTSRQNQCHQQFARIGANESAQICQDIPDVIDQIGRNQPNTFVFGYGSIIQQASRESTGHGNIGIAIPCMMTKKAGYRRCWNFQKTSPIGPRMTALGLEQSDQPDDINGVLFPIYTVDLFDKREEGYERKSYNWNPLDETPSFKTWPSSWLQMPAYPATIYYYVPKHHNPPDTERPILQSYVDICVTGCLETDVAFADHFIKTTHGWTNWINDRILARRPWVHNPGYRDVDTLLYQKLGCKTFSNRIPS